jgi:3-deoxy-7-phosphoheptulonate synthase
MAHVSADVEHIAQQQPDWENPSQVDRVRGVLASCEPLVDIDDVTHLRRLLARVAAGAARIIQAGDCAEDPADCAEDAVRRKTGLLHSLAGALRGGDGRPVLRVGRIGGQFAKPRTRPTETIDGIELPVFRGHLVNRPEPNPDARRPNPLRLLTGYMAASEITRRLGWRGDAPRRLVGPSVWTSHEALLIDYEEPLVRQLPDGRRWLSSTHWPWIGERTRQPDGAHVALLAGVANPIACKVGPGMAVDALVDLCGRLDPGREPGRLTLIARMGADLVDDRLPTLVAAVAAAGHPAIWLCDPMHGNTVSTADGVKTRFVDTVAAEVRGFRRVLERADGIAGGLHLEATPDDVVECVSGRSELGSGPYTTLCDPRLNPRQAHDVVGAWSRTVQEATA